ncbi:hypothetical protein E2C01_099649 [Portunus trituberculatus]|uniref:Uncharacterized protein n=1 Tax=Portunus trituberculatus TaxID=210409 RepID=A0A5B7KAZ9_PORTR|nr:hypothetical protein [Portunus trituberculatus]
MSQVFLSSTVRYPSANPSLTSLFRPSFSPSLTASLPVLTLLSNQQVEDLGKTTAYPRTVG